jgi:pimeloyl-ACP methyl ester carboxylesterase
MQGVDTTEAVAITEQSVEIDGLNLFYRAAARPAGAAAGAAPVLYVHGVPTHSADWLPFLVKSGGVAIDLPGFGRSDKPSPKDFSYSIGGYDTVLSKLPDALGWDRFSIVVHDWGGLALYTASQLAERVERVVIINSVPLLPGYRWHRIARLWRTPFVGEIGMGLTTKMVARQLLKEANVEPFSDDFVDMFWHEFDYGTQRAILKLYRHADPSVLEEFGQDLGLIEAPALVVWGAQDPYIPTSFAQAYADALPNATVKVVEGAGHWAWIDKPALIDQVTDFLLTGNTA